MSARAGFGSAEMCSGTAAGGLGRAAGSGAGEAPQPPSQSKHVLAMPKTADRARRAGIFLERCLTGKYRSAPLTTEASQLPLVGVIMGSNSDWDTMRHAVIALQELGVPHEVRVVSAHRTPDLLFEYAATAEERGLEVIIAGAGGAAHLPGMTAAKT